jgi:malate/lactate dehydrogenase
MKTAIIGVGQVGGAIAFALLQSKQMDEVLLVDINKDKLRGEEIDLTQASHVLLGKNVVRTGSIGDITNEHVVIITAGHPRKPGESDDILYEKNRAIIDGIAKELKIYKKVLLLTNPSVRLAEEFGFIPLGPLHRKFGDCKEIVKLKGYTNWGIAAEAKAVAEGLQSEA